MGSNLWSVNFEYFNVDNLNLRYCVEAITESLPEYYFLSQVWNKFYLSNVGRLSK